jgi:hypothetical protein
MVIQSSGPAVDLEQDNTYLPEVWVCSQVLRIAAEELD